MVHKPNISVEVSVIFRPRDILYDTHIDFASVFYLFMLRRPQTCISVEKHLQQHEKVINIDYLTYITLEITLFQPELL